MPPPLLGTLAAASMAAGFLRRLLSRC
uniref:Uncharacterized protein n=1 Tax=Arundo donax TaxID=35708 RepID=A0A0A9H5R8_ARUDO